MQIDVKFTQDLKKLDHCENNFICQYFKFILILEKQPSLSSNVLRNLQYRFTWDHHQDGSAPKAGRTT
jgi:hypothetical protein